MARNASAKHPNARHALKSPLIREDDVYMNTKRPSLKKNPHSGTSVSFVGEEEEISATSIMTPPMSYSNMRSPSFPSSKVKIKPLLKKRSLDTPSVDLSKSMAENEGLGIFAQPQRIIHTRSSSGVSVLTTGSVNFRSGSQYRQGQSYTPPMTRSRSRADSGDDLSTSYAPQPLPSRTPPPLHIRTHSTSSNPRMRSSSQTHIDLPTSASSIRGEQFSPESMGRSGRSSFDSVFRRRARTNTEDDPVAAAALVREEWFARQAVKNRRREEEEARSREKAERRQDRLNDYARRKSETNRSRANTINTINTMASSEKGSTISAIKYSNTRPGLPVDKELEFIRAGKRPPTQRQTSSSLTIRKKARGTKNAFEKFFYDLHTAWLKLLHLTGIKKAS